MTAQAFLITFDASGLNAGVAGKADPSADTTAVEAAVATLEADAATPTQAHVTALRGVWNTLKLDIPIGGITVIVDKSAITTRNQLKKALDAFALAMAGSNLLT